MGNLHYNRRKGGCREDDLAIGPTHNNLKLGKSDTFDFLVFTHYCDKSCRGNFKIGRKTKGKKFNVKVKEMNEWMKSVRNMVELKEW